MYDIEKDVENVARAMCLADGKNPEDKEAGSLGGTDGRLPNGDPCFYFWKLYRRQARAALNASTAVKELKELQDRYDALVKDEWQPIETAPKTGKAIWISDGDGYGNGMLPVYWKHDKWLFVYGNGKDNIEIEPTHWKPLPTPPRKD